MRKLYLTTAVLVIGALLLGACGTAAPTEAPAPTTAPTQPPAAPEPTAMPAEPFRVAVVMPSAINDLAFSQSMYDALLAVQAEMGGPEKACS
jgi:basic membrane protein A